MIGACTRGADEAVRTGFAGRGRGAAWVGALARPLRPSRCTLPMTAFLVMPLDSSYAIWLALNPSSQSLRRSSTRSSVQDMKSSLDYWVRNISPRVQAPDPESESVTRAAINGVVGRIALSEGPPHEMS